MLDETLVYLAKWCAGRKLTYEVMHSFFLFKLRQIESTTSRFLLLMMGAEMELAMW